MTGGSTVILGPQHAPNRNEVCLFNEKNQSHYDHFTKESGFCILMLAVAMCMDVCWCCSTLFLSPHAQSGNTWQYHLLCQRFSR